MTTGTEKLWNKWVILVLLHILLFSKLNKWYNNKWNSAMLFLFEPHFTNHEVYYTLVLCYDGINNNCDEKSWNMDTLTSCRQLFGVDYFCGILLSRTQLNTSAHHWKGPPVKHTQKKHLLRFGVLLPVDNSKHQSRTGWYLNFSWYNISVLLKLHHSSLFNGKGIISTPATSCWMAKRVVKVLG